MASERLEIPLQPSSVNQNNSDAPNLEVVTLAIAFVQDEWSIVSDGVSLE